MMNNHFSPFAEPRRGRRGIALIVVLGMLALLVLMGVAFSVFMRTERHAAGSFQHDVRAAQLLFAAKARALEALERDMAGRLYPDWVALASPGTPSTSFKLATNAIWSAHVPDNLMLDGQFPEDAGWITVSNGRIGYLIVNASGLIDANKAGGTPRTFGTSPSEIDVAGLSEMVDLARFQANRDYESVAQMKRANTAVGLSGVSHLVDFSMAVTNSSPSPVDLSGDDHALKGRAGVIKGALATYFPLINSNMVFDALLDYVDTDALPQNGNLNAPCAESVPLINELRVRPMLRATGDPASVSLMFTAQLELFYPFVKIKNTGNYTIEYSFTVAALSPAGFPVPAAPLTGTATYNFTGVPFRPINISPPTMTVVTLDPWANATPRFDILFNYIRVKDPGNNVVDQVQNLRLNVASMPNSYCTITVPAVMQNVTNATAAGSECVDPRFNYLPSYWLPYQAAGTLVADPGVSANGTIGPSTTNASTRFYLGRNDTDDEVWMYTADEPLKTPGELSYLIRGAANPNFNNTAWKTLRLLDEDTQKADPIYDVFTVNTPNSSSRGLINPNTDVPEVLAAAMRNMLLDRYPGDSEFPNQMKVDDIQAMAMATAWLSDPGSASYFSKGSMISNALYRQAVSLIVDTMMMGMPLPAPARNYRVEAAFRNLLGLMNPRQNYFIVILFAQSSARVQMPRRGDLPGEIIDTVRADQTALMELWRDPVPRVETNAVNMVTTNYPMLVRRFDILSQE
jgi:hypothetical protein